MAAGSACPFHAQRTQRQPMCMSAQAMCGMWAAASANILLIQTGVIASVSLFVLLITIISVVLLAVLVELLSLSGLTGLIMSLVGLFRGLPLDTKTGD